MVVCLQARKDRSSGNGGCDKLSMGIGPKIARQHCQHLAVGFFFPDSHERFGVLCGWGKADLFKALGHFRKWRKLGLFLFLLFFFFLCIGDNAAHAKNGQGGKCQSSIEELHRVTPVDLSTLRFTIL